MTQEQLNQLGKTLWDIADELRGSMNADDFRDYMLSFLFLRYLSDNYIDAVQTELGADYPRLGKSGDKSEDDNDARTPLQVWYEQNGDGIKSIGITYQNANGKHAALTLTKEDASKWLCDDEEVPVQPSSGITNIPADMLATQLAQTAGKTAKATDAIVNISVQPPQEDSITPPAIKATSKGDIIITPMPDIVMFEDMMRRKMHYVLKPAYLWHNIAEMARTQHDDLLRTLSKAFKYIENESFDSNFHGLFSEINLESDKLGKTYADRNKKLAVIITAIAEGINDFSTDSDTLGDAYEYLIGKFAAGSGKKAGEFYTPQPISSILSRIVTLDSQDPSTGKRDKLDSVLDFACGSGSLLLNVRQKMGKDGIGKIYGQESNITTYNLARMNMLLHGVKDSEFEIYHGDSLKNDWDVLEVANPVKTTKFDAIVANPPFSLRWKPTESMGEDFRFKNHGLAPKSAADFAFLLHGFHFLADDGTMAIILPHGVLFRGGAEHRIRKKLLEDGHIDTVIGLPANLFYSTGIPVCILVLKKCTMHDDVLFINASEHFEPGKRQNQLRDKDIDNIVDTYQHRTETQRYARRVPMSEIIENDYNLNITRYVSTAEPEPQIDLGKVHDDLMAIDARVQAAKQKHNAFLKELGLAVLP